MAQPLWQLVLIVVIGGATLAAGGYLYQAEAELSDRAVETEGEVLETEIDTFEQRTEPDDDRRTRRDDHRTETETRYRPVVVYEYEYEEHTYQSTNIYSGGESISYGSEAEAREYTDERFPEGSTVTVHVDPEDPETAYLEESSGMIPLLLIGMGGLAVLGGLLGAVRKTLPF